VRTTLHICLGLALTWCLPRADAQHWVRVNQLGYLPTSTKVAVLVSKDSILTPHQFSLINTLTQEESYRSDRIYPCGAFGPFRETFRLDFSDFQEEGSYCLVVDRVVSPPFRLGWHVYDGTADFLLHYMRQQRCGYNPFLRDSCHARDGFVLYREGRDSAHIDAVGGWHDASDYLQYVTTTATAVVQMLAAYRANPAVFGDAFDAGGLPGKNGVADILDEALWGTRWLMKMNPVPGELYNQVADDRDHRGFRLPTEDTVQYGRGRERPVYFCTGAPQGVFGYKNRSTGIASTAGKFASAFAAAAIAVARSDSSFAAILARRAEAAYAFGKLHPGVCQTAPCSAPYFYEEENWVDDMELGAAMLHELSGDSAYLREALAWGDREPVTPWMGADSARHYQWYPFLNLGHVSLLQSTTGRTAGRYAECLRRGIDTVCARGGTNAFLFGVPFIWCSNNLVSSLLTQCRLYRTITGDARYLAMESSLRDWLFGCNPWGTSMVVGLPRSGVSPRDPHSAFSHVYGYPVDGGLVDGPVKASIFAGLRGLHLTKEDAFKEFQSALAVYHDDWGDYSTDEPTMDGTAGLTMALSALENEGRLHDKLHPSQWDQGGIIRLDTTERLVYLVFSGHEFGEGGMAIRNTLHRHRVPASFFFTGDFYRNPSFARLIGALRQDGYYLGPHSDRHLLYAAWENRDSLLVRREEFIQDLRDNYRAMERFGIARGEARFFLPPYEWYNKRIAEWSDSLGVRLVNLTPGTWTNADYTVPAMGSRYVTSGEILKRLRAYEQGSPSGLNGAILLLHVGTDSRRTDKFYRGLGNLIVELKRRGYRFGAFPRR
jgi:peptidoglycan/xylan/chitin deacetylase (PgdA/CDA1 family)